MDIQEMEQEFQNIQDSRNKTIPQEQKVSRSFGDKEHQQAICDKHGSFTSVRSFLLTDWGRWSPCEKCEDEKKRDEESRVSEIEKNQIAHEVRRRISLATIPQRFESATLDNYKPLNESARKIHEFCNNYAESWEGVKKNGTSLILCGTAGTGKTHLACGILRKLLPDVICKYNEVIKVLREVKDTYSRKSEKTEGEIIKKYAEYDMLVLDEVGVQFGSETEKTILFEILNDRYVKMKPTILISNLSPAALSEVIGERVMDRMKDNGGKILLCEWQSNRK